MQNKKTVNYYSNKIKQIPYVCLHQIVMILFYTFTNIQVSELFVNINRNHYYLHQPKKRTLLRNNVLFLTLSYWSNAIHTRFFPLVSQTRPCHRSSRQCHSEIVRPAGFSARHTLGQRPGAHINNLETPHDA